MLLDPARCAFRRTCPPDWWDGRKLGSLFRTVYLRGDDSIEGWVESRPLTLAQRTEREALGAIRLARATQSDVVLDCPCGYGRHSIFLAERDFTVIGVDLNPLFMALARQKAHESRVRRVPRMIQGDMRSLPLPTASVSLVLNLVLSFGFFKTAEEDEMVLHEFARVLRPGGRLLLHTDVNPERIRMGTYGDRSERDLPGGSLLRVIERFDPASQRLEGCWEISEPDGRAATAPYCLRIYEIAELEEILQRAGFAVAGIFGSFDPDQESFSDDSQELILLAHRL